ncbi:MAG: helix-turn-helix transcriptional regulator [Lacticaseibacillus songhuajiangensis]|jgi:lambda repressor-like predicted transcriptional regulator|nr:helix-turn-helix transcriptional regulator [Lacticaseibacillus songhuajiangensis]
MKASNDLITALRRKRGEENISVAELSRQTGVSGWTLRHLLNKQRDQIRPSTAAKLNKWLYQRI